MRGILSVITGRGQANGTVRRHTLRAGGLGADALFAALDVLGDPVMISSASGQTLYANAAYYALFDLPADRLPLPGIATLLKGDDAGSAAIFRLHKAVRDQVQATEVFSMTCDGKLCLFDIEVRPLHSGQTASVWTLRLRKEMADSPASPAVQKNRVFDIVEQAPAGFAIVKPDGAFGYVNRIFASWINREQQQINAGGVPVSDFVEAAPGLWLNAAGQPAAGIYRTVVRGADGMHIPVSMIVSPGGGANGAGHEMHLFMSDLRAVSGLDLTGLEGIETRFLQLFDIAPVGIVIADPDGKILDVNTAFRRRFYDNISRGDSFIKLVG